MINNIIKKNRSFIIQYASDIHLELKNNIPNNIIKPVAPYLALLGDIGDPFSNNYYEFIKQQSLLFDKVFVIAGNHEFYNHDFDETLVKIDDVCQKISNENSKIVKFLYDDIYTCDESNITILGTTLWANINPSVKDNINDFNMIKKFNILEYQQLHNDAVKFIEKQSDNTNNKLLILSHHAPHNDMLGIYKGNILGSAFATDLSHLIKHPIIGWLNGHTHQNVSTLINNIEISSNCYGYKMDNSYSNTKYYKYSI